MRSHPFLGGGDLLLHRLVFLVRLHFHQLVFVFRQPGLDGGDFLLDLAPCRLAVREPLLGVGNGGLLCRQPLGKRLLNSRNVRNASASGIDVGVELLKADEVLEVWMQVRSDKELSALSNVRRVQPTQYTRFARSAFAKATADTFVWPARAKACQP